MGQPRSKMRRHCDFDEVYKHSGETTKPALRAEFYRALCLIFLHPVLSAHWKDGDQPWFLTGREVDPCVAVSLLKKITREQLTLSWFNDLLMTNLSIGTAKEWVTRISLHDWRKAFEYFGLQQQLIGPVRLHEDLHLGNALAQHRPQAGITVGDRIVVALLPVVPQRSLAELDEWLMNPIPTDFLNSYQAWTIDAKLIHFDE